MSMFYQGLQTVHIVFLRGFFFLNDPITKFSFEFFFTTEYIMNCWTENEAKNSNLWQEEASDC